MVLGAMQRLKVPDKFMTQITLFCSDRGGYYLNFVKIIHILWISTFHGYYQHFVDIVDRSEFRGLYFH